MPPGEGGTDVKLTLLRDIFALSIKWKFEKMLCHSNPTPVYFPFDKKCIYLKFINLPKSSLKIAQISL